MLSVSITINEVDLEVRGTYNKYVPATHLQPAEGGDFEIDSVYYEGVKVDDLIELIDSSFYEKIQTKAQSEFQ